MAPPPPSITSSNARYCYLDIDINDHRAKWARTAAFVAATDTRYGLSQSDIRWLGGSELARVPELMACDHEWNNNGQLTAVQVPVKPPSAGNRIVLELDWETAPVACENFATLCANGGGDRSFVTVPEKKIPPAPIGDSGKPLTYRGSQIHRIVPGKFLQGGDFVFGNGSGGETVFPGKRSFKDERAGLLQKHNQRGILSMGNSGKNSNTSQFFITLAPVPQCDGNHVVFGRIVSGMAVLDAMEQVQANADETPSQSITITDCGIWTPLVTPPAGYWYDKPDPQSFSGKSPLFLVQPRVAIVAPNEAAVQKFRQALGSQCLVTHSVKTVEQVETLLRQFAVDIVLVAPACQEVRLQLTQLPDTWKTRNISIDQVVLEAKPMDAGNIVRHESWLAQQQQIVSWELVGARPSLSNKRNAGRGGPPNNNETPSDNARSPLTSPLSSSLDGDNANVDAAVEEDSLLAQALKQRDRKNNHRETLIVDVFLLPSIIKDKQKDQAFMTQCMLSLAKLGVLMNDFLQTRYRQDSYPWMQGGDGPVFGIHASPANGSDDSGGETGTTLLIPHLRAECRYGVSVADEWYMVGLLMELSQLHPNVVVEFTDVEDGQILLIQAADFLPPWVDQIGPMNCAHRCWMKNGKIHLISPTGAQKKREEERQYTLSLSQALDLLNQSSPQLMEYPKITECIEMTAEKVRKDPARHRAAVLLPRSVARLIQKRPDLTAVFCESFARHIHDPLPKQKLDMAVEEEWVWLTHSFGRTSYAMLRSLVSPPDWKTETTIPMRFQSPQVKRLQRQCLNQATPHIRHALQIGVRVLAGMDAIIRSKEDTNKNVHCAEARVTNLWPLLENSCGGDGSWMVQAWNDGPNRAQYDLSNIMKCPIFQFEVQGGVTPISKADTPLEDQIRQGLKERVASGDDPLVTSIPTAEEVDKDDWMLLPTDEDIQEIARLPQTKDAISSNSKTSSPSGHEFGSMLEGFQDFVKEKSSYEGVSNLPQEKELGKIDEINLNPRIFLNLLQATLKAQSGEEVAALLKQSDGDDYFHSEDYDMGDDEDSEEGSSHEGDPLSMEIMGAMDDELAEKTMSRSKDTLGDERIDAADDDVADDIHLLTNLIRSLEAGGGAPGPVNTMLSGMGKDTPRILPMNDSDED